MTTEDKDLSTIRHPRNRRARFFAFSGLDGPWSVVVGLIALTTAFLAFKGSQFGLIVAISVVLWSWTMMVPKRSPVGSHRFKLNDRRYQRPVYTLQELYHAARKGIVWIASQKDVEQIEEQEENKKNRGHRIVKPFPLEVKYLQVDEATTIGLIYHQAKQTYSMVFKSDGSHIPSLPRAQQYEEILRFAQMISKGTASAGIKGLNIGVGVRNRPQDQWFIPEMQLEIGDIKTILRVPEIMGKKIEEYTLEEKQDAFLNKLQSQHPQVTVRSFDVDMVVVVTVKQNSVLKRSSTIQKMNRKEMKRLPIMRIRDVILPMLENQIGDVTILDLEGAERYLRKARDVATIAEYYDSAHEAVAHARRQEMKLEVDKEEEPYVPTYDRYLPNSHIILSKDHLNIDGTYAGVLDITSFPADEVYAHEMPYLYDSISRWSSMSVVGRTMNSNNEYTAVSTASGLLSDMFDAVGRIRSGPRAERKENEQNDRLTEMDSTGFNQDYVVRFATLAKSEDDLEDELSLDFDRLLNQGLGPERVIGYSQQLSKFLTTVTLIDCE